VYDILQHYLPVKYLSTSSPGAKVTANTSLRVLSVTRAQESPSNPFLMFHITCWVDNGIPVTS
jgi:hypothetical protein